MHRSSTIILPTLFQEFENFSLEIMSAQYLLNPLIYFQLSINIMPGHSKCRDYQKKIDLHFRYGIMPQCIFQLDNGVGNYNRDFNETSDKYIVSAR